MIETTESFLKIEAVFNQVLELESNSDARKPYADTEERTKVIARLCDGDAWMIAEVEALLKASEEEQQVTASRRADPEIATQNALQRKRIGPYEIDRLIGRGGMGAVYLAHRADGQFDQQVAIKLIDLPLATDLFRERFRQERQILAGLNHPLIARLLDGGVTPEGDLYLAMEFIDGVPIHHYCDKNNLDIPQRLRLFKSVCEAVQYAHQNLVVHRDLKPDNILVATDGSPRLLDFGTAKLLTPSTEVAGEDLTRQGFQSYTPQYASPEQILGNPITTATDTYSLGMLLYLLLTGTKPYELKELTTAEMVRVVCEEPPRKPGNAVGTNKDLDPDLEAIVLKAIRKEPEQRYLTAQQLSKDIEDYLSGQPVAARRGTFRYRADKFIRRNRLRLAAASVIALTLLAGVVGVLWQARIANQERRRAEARSADLRQLSNSLLSELDDAIKQLPGSTGVQKLLVTRVLDHLDRMANDAQGDRATQLDLVNAYAKLGALQGDAYDQNLGDPDGGLSSVGKALAIAEPLAAAHPEDTEVLHALASAQVIRSEILFGTGRTPESITAMQAGIHTYDRLIAAPNADVNLIADAAAARATLGDELGQPGTASLGDTAGALAAYSKAVELDHRILKIDPSFIRSRRGLAIMQMKIASAKALSDPAQAHKDFQLAAQLNDALPEAEKSTFSHIRFQSMILRKDAGVLSQLGRYDEAEPLFQQVQQNYQKLTDQDPLDIRALADLQVIYDDQAVAYEDKAEVELARSSDPRQIAAVQRNRPLNLEKSRQFYKLGTVVLERMLKLDPTNVHWKSELAYAQVKVGELGMELHPSSEDIAWSRKGLATLREMERKGQLSTMMLNNASVIFATVSPENLRDPQLAVTMAKEVISRTDRRDPSKLLSLAWAYRANGQPIEARAAAAEGLALLPPFHAGDRESRLHRELALEANH